MKITGLSSTLMLVIIYLFICFIREEIQGAPFTSNFAPRTKRHLIEIQTPRDAIRALYLLASETIDDEADEIPISFVKRGLDLGLSRGFSGTQTAKHLLGLTAANLANGPGRRRRSIIFNDQYNDH